MAAKINEVVDQSGSVSVWRMNVHNSKVHTWRIWPKVNLVIVMIKCNVIVMQCSEKQDKTRTYQPPPLVYQPHHYLWGEVIFY